MKCLITFDNDGVIMDNISFVTWEHTHDLPRELKGDISGKAVIVATDVNQNKMIIGEYSLEGYAMETVEDIMAWLADPNVNDIYYVYPEENGKALGNAPEFDYPYYYESYLKKNKEDIDHTDDLDKNSAAQNIIKNIEDIMSLHIDDVRPFFSVRTYNLLRINAHCNTVRDIINYPLNELKHIKGLGKGVYDEIIQRLNDIGINTDKYLNIG